MKKSENGPSDVADVVKDLRTYGDVIEAKADTKVVTGQFTTKVGFIYTPADKLNSLFHELADGIEEMAYEIVEHEAEIERLEAELESARQALIDEIASRTREE